MGDAHRARMSLSAGDRIGPYEVVALLGAGGMGEVYKARDQRLRRDVALKIVSPRFAFDGARMARFAREARILAALNHPNIATLYGLEEARLALVRPAADAQDEESRSCSTGWRSCSAPNRTARRGWNSSASRAC